MMKYPYDIVSIVRKKTFSIVPSFVLRDKEDDSPLKVFKDPFSRFVFTIIENGDAITANIPIEQLLPMRLKSENCYNKMQDKDSAPAVVGAGGNSPAYTITFKAGKNKGRTPADILLNEPNGKDILQSEYDWLKSNLEKYPANRTIMSAIEDAAKNVKAGSGTASAAPAFRPVTVLDVGARPLVRKTKQVNGELYCETYECSVAWDFNNKYPVRVTIQRYYAPFTKEENGLLHVYPNRKEQSTAKTHTFDMTADEWMNSLQAMEDARVEFRMLHISAMWKEADKASWEARESSKRETA